MHASSPFLPDGGLHTELARDYVGALLRTDKQAAFRLIQDASDQGVPIRAIYTNVFQPSLYELGRLWELNLINVAQEHYCTAVTLLMMARLYPSLFDHPPTGRRLVAACVSGDLHELGIRMLADMFEMSGWDTFFIGANTPTGALVDTVNDRDAHVVALSVTLRRHLPALAAAITELRAKCGEIVILVGGYPLRDDPERWRSLGADGFAPNAQDAIALADKLLPASR